MNERIAITGVGVVSPFGDSTAQFRDALLGGETAIARDPKFAAFACRSTLSARVRGFEPSKWIAPMKIRRMDTTGPFALVAIRQAIDEAGYTVTADGDPDAGVVLGTYSAGGQATNEYLEALFRGGPSGAPALLFNSTVGNAAAGLAGLEYKLCGPNATISQKEASGLAAIVAAVDLLRLGRAAALAAGGMDAIFDIFYRAHDRFAVMNASSEPGGATAPFDESRGGFVMGEGAYVLWLQPSGSVTGRIQGEVLGTGAASAITGLNAWPRDPEDLARTMQLAIQDAGLSAAAIDVVYASANADPVLDAVEARALASVFGDARPVVTSIKGAIGECGACGAAACLAAVLCGASGFVPPIAGLHRTDPAASSLQIATAAVHAPGEIVLVNSVASGGALCSVVLRVPRQH
ncbi:MAG TPA: beta-ketoacyl synthase N-terminal-like domain-containing protein [Vicinamibacterales bacterium]|nr:beta-ketoacyl synthase N-terminal-like domain-containing protein [Vicinamibacterales bacterium]